MKKIILVDQVEVLADGRVQLRLQKVVVDPDIPLADPAHIVVAQQPHRTAFDADTPIQAQIAAVNVSLVRDLKYPALDAEQQAYITDLVVAGRKAAERLVGKADATLSTSSRAKALENARALRDRDAKAPAA